MDQQTNQNQNFNNPNLNLTPSSTSSPQPTTQQPQTTPPTSPKPKRHWLLPTILASSALFIAAIITVIVTNQPTLTPNDPTPDPTTPGSSANSQLDTAFLKLESSDQNLVYSPLSIKYGLSLLSAGAAGQTKTELDNLLKDVQLAAYENVKDKLSLANAVFIRDDFKSKVLASYTNDVTKTYHAELIYDPFRDATNINNWISDKTFQLLQNVVPNDAIHAETNLALVNALAIDQAWAETFDTKNTGAATFYQADGNELAATTMHMLSHSDHVAYAKTPTATILSLDLEPLETGTQLEFIAVQPKGKTLAEYIANTTPVLLEAAVALPAPASHEKGGVAISIPKFKFDYQLEFAQDLKQLGLETAFNENANFSNMASEPLHVGTAIHKALVDFSEAGVKAAAVTVFAMDANALLPEDEPVEVHIDRPFLFLIREKSTHDLWFIGTVYQPNSWEDDVHIYYPGSDALEPNF